jgi:YVTN family beta-propeller protein
MLRLGLRLWLILIIASFLCVAFIIHRAAPAQQGQITNAKNHPATALVTTSQSASLTIRIGKNPQGVTVNRTGTRVYVADFDSDDVSVIDTANNAIIATVPVQSSPESVAIAPDDSRLYVTLRRGQEVAVIRVDGCPPHCLLTTIRVGHQPYAVALNPDGTRAYVTDVGDDKVSVIDTVDNTVVATMAAGHAPAGIVVSPVSNRAYVASEEDNAISVIDTASNTTVATVPVGPLPQGVALNPAGTRLYVGNTGSNTVSVINTISNTVVTTVPVQTHPSRIAVDPDGTEVYVTNYAADSISVIDTSVNRSIGTLVAGEAPTGIAVNPSGNLLYVAESNSNAVSVFDIARATVAPSISPDAARWPTLVITSGAQVHQHPFVDTLLDWLSQQTADLHYLQTDGSDTNLSPDLKEIKCIFYYGLDPDQPPSSTIVGQIQAWLQGAVDRQLVILGYHGQSFNFLTQFGFTVEDHEFAGTGQMAYKGRNEIELIFRLANPDLLPAHIADNRLAAVEAEALGLDGRRAPLIVIGSKPGAGRIIYLGFHPTANIVPNGGYMAFLDLLNGIYGVIVKNMMLIRIEDMDAFTDPNDLKAITDILKDQRAAYTLAVIPAYVHSGSTRIVRSLSSDEDFRQMVKAALSEGSDIVIHGYTHQQTGETGLDYEFINPTTGECLTDDQALERVVAALKEFSDRSLANRVVGWETPHYRACDSTYKNVFEPIFRYLFEDPHFDPADRLLLRPVKTDQAIYVQTPLGDVEKSTEEADIKRIVDGAYLCAHLRNGCVTSFYIHPPRYADLAIILQQFKEQGDGWDYVTPREFCGSPINSIEVCGR